MTKYGKKTGIGIAQSGDAEKINSLASSYRSMDEHSGAMNEMPLPKKTLLMSANQG